MAHENKVEVDGGSVIRKGRGRWAKRQQAITNGANHNGSLVSASPWYLPPAPQVTIAPAVEEAAMGR